MTDDYRYTIAVCNYEMAETLRESMESIVTQVTDEYEVLVVDGGSTDGSLDVLAALAAEYDDFRYVALDPDPARHLGGDRAISVAEAAGEYLLLHLDADDYYYPGIVDFVDVFHQVDDQIDDELLMVGSHITMVRRDHLRRLGSYRNLRAAEDVDLWRRALVDDDTRFLRLDCEPFWEPLGYEMGLWRRLQRTLAMKSSEFRVGIALWPYLRWIVDQKSGWRVVPGLLTTVLGYAIALFDDSYSSPDALSDRADLRRAIADGTGVEQLREEWGVEVDLSRLSERGRPYFVDEEELRADHSR